MQEPQANPSPPGVPPQAQPPLGSSPTQATDELFFEGIAKHSANIGTYMWWVGVCILGGGIAYGLLQIEALQGKPLWLLSLIGTPMLLWSYLQHISTRYKVSRRRVEFQKGVITRRLDSLESANEQPILVAFLARRRRRRCQQRHRAIEVVDLDEDLAGDRVALARYHAGLADVVVAADEGGGPEVGAKHWLLYHRATLLE